MARKDREVVENDEAPYIQLFIRLVLDRSLEVERDISASAAAILRAFGPVVEIHRNYAPGRRGLMVVYFTASMEPPGSYRHVRIRTARQLERGQACLSHSSYNGSYEPFLPAIGVSSTHFAFKSLRRFPSIRVRSSSSPQTRPTAPTFQILRQPATNLRLRFPSVRTWKNLPILQNIASSIQLVDLVETTDREQGVHCSQMNRQQSGNGPRELEVEQAAKEEDAEANPNAHPPRFKYASNAPGGLF